MATLIQALHLAVNLLLAITDRQTMLALSLLDPATPKWMSIDLPLFRPPTFPLLLASRFV
jgi:hypothetical protein